MGGIYRGEAEEEGVIPTYESEKEPSYSGRRKKEESKTMH